LPGSTVNLLRLLAGKVFPKTKNKRKKVLDHGRRQWGVERGCAPPWIFIHSTDTVARGLIELFFAIFRAFFRCPPPPRKRLNLIVLL